MALNNWNMVRFSLRYAFSTAALVLAIVSPSAEAAISCKETLSFLNSSKGPDLKEIQKTNNLRRKTENAEFAEGKPILLTGRILGTDCVPVENARVVIWQTDSKGVFAHQKPKEVDKNFAGAGETYTNNEGEFFFLTVYPGVTPKEDVPYVQIMVTHQTQGKLVTRVFFPEETKNPGGQVGDELVARNAGMRGQDVVYVFDAVLPQSDKQRRF